MTQLNRQLGRRMAYARKLAELSQEQIAARLTEHGIDTNRDRVASAETGRRPIRADEVFGYATVCERDPGWFFDEVAANLRDVGSPIPGYHNRGVLSGPRFHRWRPSRAARRTVNA